MIRRLVPKPIRELFTPTAALTAGDLVLAQRAADGSIVGSDLVGQLGASLAAVGRGAIDDSGSNSNGSYVRWKNGEQVCWTDDAGSVSPDASTWSSGVGLSVTVTWTFPASFISVPVYRPACDNGGRWIASVQNVSETDGTIRILDFDGAFSTVRDSTGFAWGYWK